MSHGYVVKIKLHHWGWPPIDRWRTCIWQLLNSIIQMFGSLKDGSMCKVFVHKCALKMIWLTLSKPHKWINGILDAK